jgi:hypothetical protein
MKTHILLKAMSSFTKKEFISTYLLYGTVLLLVGTLIYAIRPYPVDDFLRHIRYADYKPMGGYSFMFPYSYFETFRFNPWYGFDLLAGLAKNALGLDNAVIAYEIVFTCIYMIGLLVNFKTTKKSSLFSVTLIILFIFMSYGFYRIGLIRPAILISVFLLFGLIGKRFVSGLLLAIASGFFYWLFWFYTIPLALAHYLKGSRNFALGVFTGTAIALLSWGVFTDLEYVRVVASIFSTIISGRDNIVIGENIFSLGRLATPVIFLTVSLFIFTAKVRKEVDVVFLIIIFTLPLAIQIRYFLDVSLPLMVIYTVNNNLDLIESFTEHVKPTIEAFGIIAMVMITPPMLERSVKGKDVFTLKPLNIPVGSIVFTDNLPLNFHAIFYNPLPIRVIPSAEIGWNDTATKKAVKQLSDKPAIDDSFCPYFKAYRVNYVISEKNAIAGCLEFDKVLFSNTNKNITLWQVK